MNFSSQIAWTFATRLLMIVNSVAAGIVVAWWLGAEGVGALAVINVAVATVVQLGSLGLPSSNTYFIAQDLSQLRAAAINSLIFVLFVGCLLALGLSALAAARPDWFGFVPTDLIRVAAFSIPFQLLSLIGLNILLAAGKVREFNLLDLFAQSFVLINALLVLVVLNRSLTTLVIFNTVASILSGLAVAILLVISARKLAASKWRADLALLRRIIQYGIKFHISILVGAIIIRADLLVVNHFRGATETGVYSVASQFGLLLMLLPGVIATLLFPRVTAEQDARGETTCQVTRYTTFIMFLCCLAAVPFSLLLPVLVWHGVYGGYLVALDPAARRLSDGFGISAGPTLQRARIAAGDTDLLDRRPRVESCSRFYACAAVLVRRAQQSHRRLVTLRSLRSSRFTFTRAPDDLSARCLCSGVCADESRPACPQRRFLSLARQTGPTLP